MPEIEDDPPVASLPPPMMASPIQPLKPSTTEIIEESATEEQLDDIIEEEPEAVEEEEMMDTNKETTTNDTKVVVATTQNLDIIDNDFNLSASSDKSMPEELEFSMKLPFETESNPWDLVPDQPAINLPTTQQQQKSSSVEIISTKPNSESTVLWPLTMKNSDFSAKNLDNNGQNLMDDPFDADWVSLALNQSINNEKQQQPL